LKLKARCNKVKFCRTAISHLPSPICRLPFAIGDWLSGLRPSHHYHTLLTGRQLGSLLSPSGRISPLTCRNLGGSWTGIITYTFQHGCERRSRSAVRCLPPSSLLPPNSPHQHRTAHNLRRPDRGGKTIAQGKAAEAAALGHRDPTYCLPLLRCCHPIPHQHRTARDLRSHDRGGKILAQGKAAEAAALGDPHPTYCLPLLRCCHPIPHQHRTARNLRSPTGAARY
jgi:hypothetical protein